MEPLKIIYIEDNPNDVKFARILLNKELDRPFEMRRVETKKELFSTAESFCPDIILSDVSLPEYSGYEALDDVKLAFPNTPFIIVTGTMSEETAADFFKLGAWDYVVKERLIRLSKAVSDSLAKMAELEKKLDILEQLNIQKERFALAIQGSKDAIWDWDMKSNMVFLSERWNEIFGNEYSDSVMDYAQWIELIHLKDRQIVLLKIEDHLKNRTDYFESESRINTNGIEYIWILLRGKALFDEAGKAYRMSGSITDISKRKENEKELVESKEKAEESDRLKSSFLSNMSHEIRTPMNGILGFTDLISKPDITNDKKEYYAEIIKSSTTRLLRLLTDIIDFSKIESREIKIFNSTVSLNKLIDQVCAEAKINMVESLNPDVTIITNIRSSNDEIRILTDESRMKQILLNLVQNAIRFTSRGTIEVGYEDSGENGMVFHVKDTGIGIAEEHKFVIFDRFRQVDETSRRHHDGTGLGLAISKGLVEALGGHIWFESEMGKGSAFYFSIPFNSNEKMINEDHFVAEKSEHDIMDLKILIVEDDEINQQLLAEFFNEGDANIQFAPNGMEAITIFKKTPDFDVVLMDMKLPDMSGIEVTKQIKEINPQIKVIAQTAYAMDNDRDSFIKEGCDEYIKKPYDIIKLFQVIQSVVNE